MSHRFRSLSLQTAVAALLLAGAIATGSAAITSSLLPQTSANFCVTLGTLFDISGGRISVVDPQIRATLHRRTYQAIESHVTYWGRTAQVVPLGSGEIREQFGFKLRAEDPCNLIYAMWRFKQEALVVSVKSNPGMHTSAECRNNGYHNITPAFTKPVPAPRHGEFHTLRASLNGSLLKVFLDNDVVWQGDVGAETVALNGPVGIRSDNVKLTLKLFAPRPIDVNDPPYFCSADPD